MGSIRARNSRGGARRSRIASANTFEAVALEWLELKQHDWTEKNAIKERGRLVNHCFPWIGKLPIEEVGTAEIRSILDRILKHRNLDTAHRVRQTLSSGCGLGSGKLELRLAAEFLLGASNESIRMGS